MHVNEYLSLVRQAEENLSKGLKKVIAQHVFETDVVEMCERFSHWSEQHLTAIDEFIKRRERDDKTEGPDLFAELFGNMRMGPFGLLRDLHALSLLIHEAHTCWTILNQGAMALRDLELEQFCKEAGVRLNKESMWVTTRIKSAAPQILVVS